MGDDGIAAGAVLSGLRVTADGVEVALRLDEYVTPEEVGWIYRMHGRRVAAKITPPRIAGDRTAGESAGR